VREGDLIDIDIDGGTLSLLVDEQELEKRKEGWRAPDPPISTGYLGRYAKQVTSAATGAVFADR
jgi:dihydroxy-acid dehydratase